MHARLQLAHKLTTQQIDPIRNRPLLLAALDHLERLIQQHLPCLLGIDDFHQPIRNVEPEPTRVPDDAQPPPHEQLRQDTATERVGDGVVPEGEVPLLVFETQEQRLLHEGQARIDDAIRGGG